MKRSEALAPLSRDHHQALEVALRLRRATPGSVSDAASRFLAFWNDSGQRHFEIEERLVLGVTPPAAAAWSELVARVRAEHADITRRADALAAGDVDLDGMHELGQRLHDHVRFEERELFGMLEAGLPEEALTSLGTAVAEAHRA